MTYTKNPKVYEAHYVAPHTDAEGELESLCEWARLAYPGNFWLLTISHGYSDNFSLYGPKSGISIARDSYVVWNGKKFKSYRSAEFRAKFTEVGEQ